MVFSCPSWGTLKGSTEPYSYDREGSKLEPFKNAIQTTQRTLKEPFFQEIYSEKYFKAKDLVRLQYCDSQSNQKIISHAKYANSTFILQLIMGTHSQGEKKSAQGKNRPLHERKMAGYGVFCKELNTCPHRGVML